MEGVNNNQGRGSFSRLVVFTPENRHPDDTDSDNMTISSGGRAPSSPIQRPRGRPPGSKNKPKPPVVVTRDISNSIRSNVFEVSAGTDILDSLNNYAVRKGRGVCVLNGSGKVSNVTIRHPTSTVVTLRGAFEILSLSGTVLPPPAPPGSTGLSIFFSGGQGQVVGGFVAGPLIATERVVLATATFANAVVERLPLESQAAEENARGDQVQPVQAAASQSSSGVTGGGVPLFNGGPPHGTYAFSAGWPAGGSNVAPRTPF